MRPRALTATAEQHQRDGVAARRYRKSATLYNFWAEAYLPRATSCRSNFLLLSDAVGAHRR
jgi:hypothetical protein